MVSTTVRVWGEDPPSKAIVTSPGQALLCSHTISYVDPAGTSSPSLGFVMALKPPVGPWATTADARARRAVIEKRILFLFFFLFPFFFFPYIDYTINRDRQNERTRRRVEK